MALSATTVWEVQATGDNTNGGGFDANASGTDYTYGGTLAVTSYTDLVISATNTAQITSAAHPFNSTHVGNVINVTGGTGFTVGRYQITSVASAVATLDSAVGTLSSTGGTGKLGGALADVGLAVDLMVGGNDVYVKTGTYSVTSSTVNITGGCLSVPAGSTGDCSQVIGYQTTRGDGGTKPILQAVGISSFTLATLTNQTRLDNLELDGNNLTTGKGVSGSQFGEMFRCRVRNCTSTAINGIQVRFCEATGNSSAVYVVPHAYGCTAYSNTGNAIAFSLGAGCEAFFCLAANNGPGSNAHGFSMTSNGGVALNCVSYGNGGDGFRTVGGAAQTGTCVNCIAEGNTGTGFNSTTQTNMFRLVGCATALNTGGAMTNFSINIGPILNSATAFVNAAGLDFRLNTTAGAGALLRAAGYPQASGLYAYPGLSTPAYPDIGAAQHQDAGGGSSGGPGRISVYRGQNLPVW